MIVPLPQSDGARAVVAATFTNNGSEDGTVGLIVALDYIPPASDAGNQERLNVSRSLPKGQGVTFHLVFANGQTKR